jgi:hypothetical protein
MKSQVKNLLIITRGLIEDVRVAYPQYGGVDRDFARLALNCQTRGLGFFTLDLPHLDACLIDALESGRLALWGPASRPVSKRIQVPRLFAGLWLRVFDKAGCLLEHPDETAIFLLRQLCCIGKKVQLMCSPERLVTAKEAYHDIEAKIPNPTLAWDKEEFDPDCVGSAVSLSDCITEQLPLFRNNLEECDSNIRIALDRCQQVADLITREMTFFEPLRYSNQVAGEGRGSGFRHGPGAVADRRGLVNKYDMPRWSSKLEQWFPYRECGTIASDVETIPLNHEVASKLIAVAKTAKAPRLIASEPTEHQFCQQLIRHYMVRELKSLFGEEFICFEKQCLSQQMVVHASLDRKLATIDLSSASDRLSCWTVERVLRGNPSLLHALHAARTRYIKTDVGSFIKLKKFASQGTATTFPVQTLVFLILALGACIEGKVTWTKIRRLGGKVRVFGDDIIVPTHRYADVTAVLTKLGLKVNTEKSFFKGYFRESCGMDAYKGICVTPVKPEVVTSDNPSSRKACIDTANNLFKKGLWHAAAALESTMGSALLRVLPITGRGEGLTGRYSFVGGTVQHLKERWNDRLHRWEYRMYASLTRTPRVQVGERFAMLQWFTEAPSQDMSWENGFAGRPRPRDGLRWCALY